VTATVFAAQYQPVSEGVNQELSSHRNGCHCFWFPNLYNAVTQWRFPAELR
jgi:hypothetical protein